MAGSKLKKFLFPTEEEYIPNEEKVIFLDTKYVVIDDENGDIVLDYITE